MSRWIPYPPLVMSVFLIWLLLTQTFSVGQAILGATVAILAARAMARLRPPEAGTIAWQPIFRLTGAVVADVIRSNIAVASIILSPRRKHVSGFITVPLILTDRHGLAILALIITATPGTLWVEFDRKRGTLLIHVLDLVDEGEWIRLIKSRYEEPLMRIFVQ